MSNVRVNYKSGVTAGRGMEIVSSRRSNRHQLGPYAVAETRTPSVPVSARPNVASIDSLPWSVGIPLFEYPNLVSQRGPKYDTVMIVAFQARLVDGAESPVERADTVPARLDVEQRDRAPSALFDLKVPGRQMEARLGDVVPTSGFVRRLRVVDLDLNTYCHIALGLNNDDMGPSLDAILCVCLGIVLRGNWIHSAIPEIKLMVIGEQLERAMLQLHCQLRSLTRWLLRGFGSIDRNVLSYRSYATTLTVPRVPKWEATARRPRRLRSLRKRSELSFLL
jgi:hypothetical protein